MDPYLTPSDEIEHEFVDLIAVLNFDQGTSQRQTEHASEVHASEVPYYEPYSTVPLLSSPFHEYYTAGDSEASWQSFPNYYDTDDGQPYERAQMTTHSVARQPRNGAVTTTRSVARRPRNRADRATTFTRSGARQLRHIPVTTTHSVATPAAEDQPLRGELIDLDYSLMVAEVPDDYHRSIDIEHTVGNTERNERNTPWKPRDSSERYSSVPRRKDSRIVSTKSSRISKADLHDTNVEARLSRLDIAGHDSASRSTLSNLFESDAAKMEGSHGLEPVDNRPSSKPDLTDADSTSSASDSDWSTYAPSLDQEHWLFQFKSSIFDEVMHEFRTMQNGAIEGNPTTGDSERLAGVSSAATSGIRNSDKRKLDCQGDDDEEQSLSVSTSRKRLRTSSRLTFACPFCKKDPSRYRTCYRYILSRIRDVKQHISRCHRLPVYCPSCMDTFDTEALRDEHSRARSCPTRPVVQFDGVTEEQKKLLARRISSRLSEEEQWYAVFDILFVGHPRPPSPYIDQQLSEEMHGFRDFAISQGPRIIRTHLGRHVSFHSPDIESDLETFQDYIYGQCLQRIFEEWESNSSPASSGDASHSVTPPCSRALTDNRLEQVTASPSRGPPDASPGSADDATAFSSILASTRREREHLAHQAASSQPAVDSSAHAHDSSVSESSLPLPFEWSTEMTQDGIDFSAWDPDSSISRETDLLLLPETVP